MSETRTPLKVTQEKLAGSQVSLEIAISADRAHQAYEQVIIKHMRSAQIPGFRKGKVPRQVVLQRFGTEYLKAVALEDLVQKVLDEAIQQEDIPVLGNLQLLSAFDDLVSQFQPGADVTFVASADVPPEVTLAKIQGFVVEAEEVVFDPQKVEATLLEQQKSRATLVPVEGRAAVRGDVVVIDFSGRYASAETEGDEPVAKEIEGGSASDFQLELEESQFVPGFVEGVVGMSVGETREIAVTFPDDYFQADLAGQPAVFSVTLNEIKAKELPPLDDDFAQEISEFDTLEALKQFLEERYQKEAQNQTDANIEAALMEALLEGLEVELPETLIRNEVNFLINQTAYQLQSQGIDLKKLMTPEIIEGMRDRTRPEAITRVRRTLALAEVAKQAALTVDESKLEARVQELLQQENGKNLDPDRLHEVLSEEMLQEQVLTWLKEHSQVTLVPAQTEATPAAPVATAADADVQEIEPAVDADAPQAQEKAQNLTKASDT